MSTAPSTYVPVPVDIARQIAERFGKSAVVIWSHDPLHELMHMTTYGATAEDKLQAACLGDVFAKAAGMDLVKQAVFEDFRTRSAAESTAIIEKQAAELHQLRSLLLDIDTVNAAGLIDQVDNNGKLYQSQSAADHLARLRKGGW